MQDGIRTRRHFGGGCPLNDRAIDMFRIVQGRRAEYERRLVVEQLLADEKEDEEGMTRMVGRERRFDVVVGGIGRSAHGAFSGVQDEVGDEAVRPV